MNVTGDSGAIDLQRALARLSTEVREGAAAVVTTETMMLEAAVKRHASQPRTHVRPLPSPARPEGPRMLTGSYVGSIHSKVDIGAFQTSGSVGSNDARAMPLELGSQNLFGRGVRMRSYPHYGPAMDEREEHFYAAMAAVPLVAAQKTRGGRVRGLVARLFGRAS